MSFFDPLDTKERNRPHHVPGYAEDQYGQPDIIDHQCPKRVVGQMHGFVALRRGEQMPQRGNRIGWESRQSRMLRADQSPNQPDHDETKRDISGPLMQSAFLVYDRGIEQDGQCKAPMDQPDKGIPDYDVAGACAPALRCRND